MATGSGTLKKKNNNLAALLSDDAQEIEKRVTGLPVKPAVVQGSGNGSVAEIKPSEELISKSFESEQGSEFLHKEEPKMALEDELGLAKAFTRVFKKNARYEKAPKTTTIVYADILARYHALSEKMDVDTIVVVNNVLAEWYNKHLEVVDKVVNRKLEIKAL